MNVATKFKGVNLGKMRFKRENQKLPIYFDLNTLWVRTFWEADGEKKEKEAICTFFNFSFSFSFKFSFKGWFSTEDASLEEARTQICQDIAEVRSFADSTIFWRLNDGANFECWTNLMKRGFIWGLYFQDYLLWFYQLGLNRAKQYRAYKLNSSMDKYVLNQREKR